MPKSFDENEIFVLFVAMGLFLFFIILPKRFPLHLFILLFLINSYIGRTVDTSLAIRPFNIYDSFDGNTHEILDEITYSIVYPIYGYLFYYFYDKYYMIPSWIHLIVWAASSTLFEWISTRFNVFQYHNQHILYSFFVYLLVFMFHILFFRWVTNQLKYSSERVKLIQGKRKKIVFMKKLKEE